MLSRHVSCEGIAMAWTPHERNSSCLHHVLVDCSKMRSLASVQAGFEALKCCMHLRRHSLAPVTYLCIMHIILSDLCFKCFGTTINFKQWCCACAVLSHRCSPICTSMGSGRSSWDLGCCTLPGNYTMHANGSSDRSGFATCWQVLLSLCSAS